MTTTDIVRRWFAERIATGAVARDTEAHNQVFAALPDLVARLDAAATPTPEPTPPVAEPAAEPVSPADPAPAQA